MSLDFLSLLAADVDRFVAAIEHGPAEAPIAGCPGWTLVDLGVHLGSVHRWARGAIITGAVPQQDPSDQVPSEHAAVAQWVRDGADRLLTTLSDLDPAAPTWHPFPVEPRVAGLWRRRQAQEASVHRWDAERAIGMAPTIEREFAEDGVDEYWTVMLPRLVTRESLTVPASVIEVQLSDTGRNWTVDGRTGSVLLAEPGTVPAAQLRGTAADVLLRLWGRPVADGAVNTSGDVAVVDEWLAMGGA